MPADLVAIASQAIEVELLPAIGARLHRLRVHGHDLLRTPHDAATHAADPFAWGAYVMAPWCNRLPAVPTDVLGRLVDLPANFSDGSAIHGQVYAAPWTVEADGRLTIAGGGDAWPWPYRCSLHLVVAEASVAIHLSLTNLADAPMPAGLGLHPWFRRPLALRLDASHVVSNVDPQASIGLVTAATDLRALRPVPDDLDATWLAPADPVVELRWPEVGLGARMRIRSNADSAVAVASPASLDAVAVEAQTHAPQGLRRFLTGEPGGLHELAPGESLRVSTELDFQRFAAGAEHGSA